MKGITFALLLIAFVLATANRTPSSEENDLNYYLGMFLGYGQLILFALAIGCAFLGI